MPTGVIPGSGIPSFNMTSAASHNSSPAAFTTSIWPIISWIIATAVGHSIKIIVLVISFCTAASICNASAAWFKTSNDQPKPVGFKVIIDDTKRTPDQAPTPDLLYIMESIDVILSRMDNLDNKLKTDHDQLRKCLEKLYSVVHRNLQQQNLTIA